MPKTRTGPVTVALFAGGAVIGLAVAAIWGYRALVDPAGPTLVQAVAPAGEPDSARAWLAAETLYLDGLAAEDEGKTDEARRAYAKAAMLYGLLQPTTVLPTGFPEATARIADIEARLAALG